MSEQKEQWGEVEIPNEEQKEVEFEVESEEETKTQVETKTETEEQPPELEGIETKGAEKILMLLRNN